MKTLRITTYWTPEEADCVYQLLDELKAAVWSSYGKEITEMHKAVWEEEQQERKDEEGNENDELLF
tara:strand:+ start:1098 stop:1295 length:198 start_codon:yes stop_codon:yes gene_type:complete